MEAGELQNVPPMRPKHLSSASSLPTYREQTLLPTKAVTVWRRAYLLTDHQSVYVLVIIAVQLGKVTVD